ncbi:MAG: phosphate ABC transporter substrate-binding protein, partial [Spirochaetales bacterium]|nr:phosphate ABC transporter substrate-binding protein [Spirochaetales bacterium]
WSGSYAFGGSTTLEPIILAAAEVMMARYPEVQISYDAPGSSAGVTGAIDGTYSLGCASRELKDSEIEKGAVATPIALDGVAVVVNKASVGIDNLSLEQVTAIYAGEITNWSAVGGADAEIVVINRDEASGTRDCFKSATVKPAKKSFDETALIVTGNGDMVAKVGATPNAIGYCGFGYITKDPGTKAITVDEIEPTEANVLSGDYAISRKLNVISKGQFAEGSFEAFFLNYLLSAEGQEIAASKKFIKL